ncbi:kinesin-like protein [Plakobranchus ocellatus]|uniref:Kinesin-like protein n=1 Tax=Plakobranchus ocellatus TaxID=259542 RepID=A0AAV3Y246_9GAST|nr:kinesin-like protein [Plakobranchus ocellatus]
MVKQTIQIFARVKPTKPAKTGLYEVDEDEGGNPRLQVVVPRELASGFINNKKENYSFRFDKVFDQRTSQDEVFEAVARPVIDNVVQGYNGTIFAYGQTGSGKTFTITGGAERYMDRGIIPRSLSYIFETFQKFCELLGCIYIACPQHGDLRLSGPPSGQRASGGAQAHNRRIPADLRADSLSTLPPISPIMCACQPDKVFTAHISYLELYNESGYDLLDPKHEATKLEDLPKVSLMEDSDQNIHLKNLTVHPAQSEEDALNLLFMGDTNRMIAETPMNQASSRSHCIFTVHLTSKEEGSATIRRAKLHLVDLAGSERVAKTGVNGTLLTEAKYINLSLHFLEQVIIALSEKNRQHVPYRNSMMTSVLRDSLGGNCMTSMIATCSMEKRSMDESISTCRFAQRVAMIKNDVSLNEELDPRLLIAKLKRENAELRDQLAMATGEQLSEQLTPEEIERCEEAVKNYLQDPDPESVLNVGHDLRKIQKCFKILKKYILEKPHQALIGRQQEAPSREVTPPDVGPYRDAETTKLKELVEQRDNEINILVNMLKKERQRAADVQRGIPSMSNPRLDAGDSGGGGGGGGSHRRRNSDHVTGQDKLAAASLENGHGQGRSKRPESDPHKVNNRQRTFDVQRSSGLSAPAIDREDRMKTKILGNMSLGRQEAFDIFMRDYRDRKKIDSNKEILKKRYSEAKTLGQQLNKSKQKMNHLKNSLAQIAYSKQYDMDVNAGGMEEESPMEVEIRKEMNAEKHIYKETFNSLRTMKTEIEHLQHFLEKSKVQLMKDFELWWAEQSTMNPEQGPIESLPPAASGQRVLTAWNTPPITPLTPTPPEGHSSLRSSQYSGQGQHADPIIRGSNSRQGNHRPVSRPPSQGGSTPGTVGQFTLTGDSKVDADIQAFVRARQNILQKGNFLLR